MNFNNATFEASFGTANQIFKSTSPEVIFSGRSNVGKSSLINKLVNRKSLARVSAKPGKTGTINFYKVDKIRFVDLPGYGYAKVSIREKERWTELMEGYFKMNRNFALMVQIIDMRHEPSLDDLNMIEFLKSNNFNFIVVLTKSDKLSKTQRVARLEQLKNQFLNDNIKFIEFSSLTGVGVEKVKSEIEIACKN